MTRGPEASFLMARQVQAVVSPGAIVAGYWAIGDELDLGPTLTALAARGDRLALPVTGRRGSALVFRQWVPGEPLESGPMGTSHPRPSAPAVTPTVLLIPLLAFDARGARLGYGAGFYDRTLAALRAAGPVAAWGIAFDEQEEPEVPIDSRDQPLTGIITDRRVIRVAGA
jgi:5-formyltetrahydrofolate cyclo-ligase